MLRVRVGVASFIFATSLCGCQQGSVSWVRLATAASPRAPESVRVYLSRRTIRRPYRVVARYHARFSGTRLSRALRRVARKAARHGCDAILVKRVVGATQTVWSWVFLLIPITESYHDLEVVGLRFTPLRGQP